MIDISLKSSKRRRWTILRRRRFDLCLPQCWEEVTPYARRVQWWTWAATLGPEEALQHRVRDLVPAPWLARMDDLDRAAVEKALDWVDASPNVDIIPVPHLDWKGVRYAFTKPKGANVTAVEFALCDDYYSQFMAGDPLALLRLMACLWREEDQDRPAMLRRGDARVLLYSKEEVESRVEALHGVGQGAALQGLLWFIGMKQLVHKMYGNWIFQAAEQEEEEDPIAKKPESTGPNFGWWGIFLDVAESGVFGTLEKVYQTPIHDICIFLVKKRADANQAPEPSAAEAEND